ncbi:hypothetical protein [Burkholderia cepacia]|uniref:hypothetical protein n=1 Tax=Burkholderia cepacia TaxID=292 RepID=UPI002653B9B3|nr:hypothetical protein [Burkholderia cepacia]
MPDSAFPSGSAPRTSSGFQPGRRHRVAPREPDAVSPGLDALQAGSPSNWGSIREPDVLSTLDEISASELIRDLEGMRE